MLKVQRVPVAAVAGSSTHFTETLHADTCSYRITKNVQPLLDRPILLKRILRGGRAGNPDRCFQFRPEKILEKQATTANTVCVIITPKRRKALNGHGKHTETEKCIYMQPSTCIAPSREGEVAGRDTGPQRNQTNARTRSNTQHVRVAHGKLKNSACS